MIQRPLTFTAALLAVALAAAPVHAQSKKELVSRLLLLQQPGVEAMAKNLAEQPAIQMTMAARQAFGNVPADKREAVAKAIDADLKKYTDEAVPLLRDRAIKLAPSTIGTELETNFNEAELKQLIEWFESPVIKRFNQIAPGMQRTLADKLVNETRGQIEPKLKVLETSMAKNLGLPPAGEAPAGSPGPGPAPGGGAMPGNRK
jgi:hypothetical protein